MRFELKRWSALCKKYLWVGILLAAALALLLLPTHGGSEAETAPVPFADEAERCAAQLEKLLSRTAGVGRAEVILTLDAGARSVYARENESKAEQDGDRSSGSEKSNLAREGSGSSSAPVTEQVEAPLFRGAVVACTGGDRADVRLRVTEAVMALTGLPSDRITVLKLD